MRGTAPGATGEKAFARLWDSRVKTDIQPETYAPQAFDATLLALLAQLKAAVDKAGSNDAADVTNEFDTVTSRQISAQLQSVSRDGTKYGWENLEDAISAVLDGKDINYEGASGPVDLDKDGNVESVGALYDVYVYKNGKLEVSNVVEAAALS
jgi:hypothetical protein